MFNFAKDSSAANLEKSSSFSLNGSLPRWGVLFDSNGYLLIYDS